VPEPRAPDTAPVRVTRRCAGCGACLLTCPQRAIRPLGGTLLVRPDLCDGCGECVEVCPVDAIDLVDSVDAIDAVDAIDGPPGAAPDPLPDSPSGGAR